jgi:hypothetical protein
MKIEQFLELEKICKDAWSELAETGGDQKPESLSKFYCKCPACEISKRVRGRQQFECFYCPIDIWRKDASENDYPLGTGLCVHSFYGIWTKEYGEVEQRRKMARQIANLSWMFLPEYENIDVSDLLEED